MHVQISIDDILLDSLHYGSAFRSIYEHHNKDILSYSIESTGDKSIDLILDLLPRKYISKTLSYLTPCMINNMGDIKITIDILFNSIKDILIWFNESDNNEPSYTLTCLISKQLIHNIMFIDIPIERI